MFIKKAPLQNDILASRPLLSPYEKFVLELIQKNGGFWNGHAHLDRADTIDDIYLRHINMTPLEASLFPLSVKQNLVGDLHKGVAYTEDNLRERMSGVLDRLIAYGTTGLATCIDVTPDIGEDGLLAWRVAQELKGAYADKLTIRLGPHAVFGFKEGSGRWEVYREAAKQADFLAALPEKDLYQDPKNRDGKVGYRRSIKMVFDLACELGREVHLHLDQANDPAEEGAKTLIEGLRWLDQPVISGQTDPVVWIIHEISPSAYSEYEFARVIDGHLEHNIGAIVCSAAAVSMRQLRPISAPTRNSIARVLELAKAKVPIQLGSDNICDLFVPQASGDMLLEVITAGLAVRYSGPDVWAKIAAGEKLNAVDRTRVGQALYQDEKAYKNIAPDWKSALDMIDEVAAKRWY